DMLWSFIRHIWQFSLVLAFLQQGKVISDEGCWCNGVEIAVSNVKHCFELAIPKQNSWTQANDDCVGSGGHLAHITNSYTYNLLLPHLKQECFSFLLSLLMRLLFT
uniref:C-type lectin domain-containing protein n=1 Tax=Parascaris univalens TaxID=6257 RepID=A0A915BB21_PARUN